MTRRLMSMANPRTSALTAVLAILVLAGPVLLLRLGSYSFVNADEAGYQAMAEHMVESGDWSRLEFRTEHRLYDTFLNAPLHYWARASLIAVFGSNLWTARITSATFGLATLVVIFFLADRLADRRAAIVAALVQLTTVQFVYLHSARTGELETGLTFFVTLGALLFLRSVGRGASFIGHHLCLIGLFLTKSPLVIVPLVAELIFFASVPSSRSHLRRWLRQGLLLLPLALAWHAYQLVVHFDEVREIASMMWGHAVGEPAGAAGFVRAGLLDNARFYGSAVLFGSQPWAWFFPVALVSMLARRRGPDGGAFRLLALHLAVVLVFYVLLAKRAPWYVIPAYPFLAVFLGAWLSALSRQAPGTRETLAIAAAIALTLSTRVPLDWNPFRAPAFYIAMPWHMDGLPGAGPVVSIVLLTGAGAWLLGRGRRLLGGAWPRVLARGLGASLLAFAALRVVLPLRHLGHQSPIARLHEALETARHEATPIPFPVSVPSRNLMLVRYYFGKDYRLTVAPRAQREAGVFYLILPREEGAR